MNNYWKALFSPLKPFKLQFYFGKVAVGVPYFLPRKLVKCKTKPGFMMTESKKFGFNYCGLGWKTKWSPTDYRFEWRPTLSFVAFKLQIAIMIIAPDEPHYWEIWLNWEHNTDKKLNTRERLKQCRERYPCIWISSKQDGTETKIDYYEILLKQKYLKLKRRNMTKKDNDLNKFVKGRKAKCLKNTTCGAYFTAGNTVTIELVNANNKTFTTKEQPSYWQLCSEFEAIALTPEYISKQIAELTQEIKELEVKKQYLIENQLNEFDETQFKVYFTLKTLKDENLNDLEKSTLIADLISS